MELAQLLAALPSKQSRRIGIARMLGEFLISRSTFAWRRTTYSSMTPSSPGFPNLAVCPAAVLSPDAVASGSRRPPDPAASIDEERAVWLVERGYDVIVDTIPANISAKNRLLLGRPRAATPSAAGAGTG